MADALYTSIRLKNPPDAITEYILARAWIGFADDQLLNTIWPGRAMLLSEFLEWYRKGHVYASCMGGADNLNVAGLGWAMGLEASNLNRGYRAEVGMGFMRRYQGTEQTLDMARFMIQDGFDNLAISDMFGVIPVENKAAADYARRMGFTSAGIKKGYRTALMPNGTQISLDCEVFEMSKEHWAELESKRRFDEATEKVAEENPSWAQAIAQSKTNSR